MVGLNVDDPDPAIGGVDEKGLIFGGGAPKGIVAGLPGYGGRPGFSVPIEFYKLTYPIELELHSHKQTCNITSNSATLSINGKASYCIIQLCG